MIEVVAVGAGKMILSAAAKASIGAAITKFREARFNSFLESLAESGVSESQLNSFLESETKCALLEKVAEAVTKSGTRISRLALARILGEHIKDSGRYRSFEVSRATESISDLDDIDALMLIAWVEVSRNFHSDVSKQLSVRPLTDGVCLPLAWKVVEQHREFVPDVIRTEFELDEVMHRLIKRGIFHQLVGFSDYNDSQVKIGEFGLKLKEDLAIAADLCEHKVPASDH